MCWCFIHYWLEACLCNSDILIQVSISLQRKDNMGTLSVDGVFPSLTRPLFIMLYIEGGN